MFDLFLFDSQWIILYFVSTLHSCLSKNMVVPLSIVISDHTVRVTNNMLCYLKSHIMTSTPSIATKTYLRKVSTASNKKNHRLFSLVPTLFFLTNIQQINVKTYPQTEHLVEATTACEGLQSYLAWYFMCSSTQSC